MIIVKSDKDIVKMRAACKVVKETHEYLKSLIKAGVTTAFLDSKAEEFIIKQGAKPNFKYYRGFPNATCISVNDVVVHGIPSVSKVLKEGDIVSIDLGAALDGFNGDAARTWPVGNTGENRKRLIKAVEDAFFESLKVAREGFRVGDISNAIQRLTESRGYGVVRVMVGHGIGRKLHEDPVIANYGSAGSGAAIKRGYTFAIEPMINEGTFKVRFDNDGWTCRTADGRDSAHYENTILITAGEPEILTL